MQLILKAFLITIRPKSIVNFDKNKYTNEISNEIKVLAFLFAGFL